MTDLTLYGLPHCGTCKKAIAWLQTHDVAHRFVDYRAEPLSAEQLRQAAAQLGWEKLVNRASMTWRNLPEDRKQPADEAAWLALVSEFPTLIGRPLAIADGQARAGFSEKAYAAAFGG